jgi:hypothetical protein
VLRKEKQEESPPCSPEGHNAADDLSPPEQKSGGCQNYVTKYKYQVRVAPIPIGKVAEQFESSLNKAGANGWTLKYILEHPSRRTRAGTTILFRTYIFERSEQLCSDKH